MSRERLKRIVIFVLAFGGIGLAYGVFVQYTGWGIPCPVFYFSGLKCPGCGVTHMCVALLRFDFRAAFTAHPMLLVQLPFLSLILLRNVIRYLRSGVWQLTKLESGILYGCIVLLLFFSVERNWERLLEILEWLRESIASW